MPQALPCVNRKLRRSIDAGSYEKRRSFPWPLQREEPSSRGCSGGVIKGNLAQSLAPKPEESILPIRPLPPKKSAESVPLVQPALAECGGGAPPVRHFPSHALALTHACPGPFSSRAGSRKQSKDEDRTTGTRLAQTSLWSCRLRAPLLTPILSWQYLPAGGVPGRGGPSASRCSEGHTKRGSVRRLRYAHHKLSQLF